MTGQWKAKWSRLCKKVFKCLYSAVVIQYLINVDTLWVDSNSSKNAVQRKCNFWVKMLNKHFRNINLISKCRLFTNIFWPGWLSRYSDYLWVSQFGDQIPVGARFSTLVHTGPGAQPNSYSMVNPGVKAARVWRWTPTLHLASRLKKE